MENLIIIPENEKQLSLLKALLQEMRIKFRSEKAVTDKISLELEKRIKQARKEKEKGDLITVNPHQLWESI